MQRLPVRQQLQLIWLSVGRGRRRIGSRLRRSRAMRWLSPPPIADELVLLPQDLRSTDPSLIDELEADQLGLGGAHIDLGGHSPFAMVPPNAAWARELHGFGWLRDLRASGSEAATVLARRYVAEWIDRYGRSFSLDAEHAVVARRVISWISHAGLILDERDPRSYEAIMRSLAEQVHFLATCWQDAPDGYPRLLCITAVVLADLCLAGNDRQLARAQRAFSAEIERQIHADGGHISRHPGIPIELLLDFLPLRQCYIAREREPPPALVAAIRRMILFLRGMRLGNGTLARFNGMGRTETAALVTVLTYDEAPEQAPPPMPQSLYQRLARDPMVLVMDVGPPPPLALAGEAHAGPLSFELTIGGVPVVINCGAPGPAHEQHRITARATASHSTLVLADRSTAHLIRNRMLGRWLGAPALQMTGHMSARFGIDGAGIYVSGSHGGYVREHGLVHTRLVHMRTDGLQLSGEDRLAPPRGTLRTVRDVPFAIRFHLDPGVECRVGSQPGVATLDIPGQGRWVLSVDGARLTIEQSLDFAHYSGPRRCQQVVLRGSTPGESLVRWQLTPDGRRVPMPSPA